MELAEAARSGPSRPLFKQLSERFQLGKGTGKENQKGLTLLSSSAPHLTCTSAVTGTPSRAGGAPGRVTLCQLTPQGPFGTGRL